MKIFPLNKYTSLLLILILILPLVSTITYDAQAGTTGSRRETGGGGGGGGGGFIFQSSELPAPKITEIEQSLEGSIDIIRDTETNQIIFSDTVLETDEPILPATIKREDIVSLRDKYESEFGVSVKTINGKFIPRPIKLINKTGNARLETNEKIVIINEYDSNTLIAPQTEQSGSNIKVNFSNGTTKFLRPITVSVNVGKMDRRELEIVDKNGEVIRNFDLLADGTLQYKTNVLQDFIINFIDPLDPTPLKDIDNDPEKSAILNLQERGIIKGHPDGNFRGNETLIRAETSKIVAKLAGINPVETSTEDKWYVGYDKALQRTGVVQGTIDPTTPENRANYLALIAKAKGLNIYKLPQGIKYFTDIPDDAWYNNLVSYAVAHGWIKETSGVFNPGQYIDRSTAAGWASRAL